MSKNEPFRILIFGETGTGKTSACNALSGQCKPTSSRAVGVTFQSQDYLPFIRNDKSYIITDTVCLVLKKVYRLIINKYCYNFTNVF
jgi:predicted GTPase